MSVVKRFFSKISILIASVIALYSAQPYFSWDTNVVKVILLALFLIVRFLFLERRTLLANKLPLYFCCVLWLYLYAFHAPELRDAFSSVFTRFLPLLAVILFVPNEKRLFLVYTTNLFALFILISLIAFTLWFSGVSFPSSLIENTRDSFYPQFTNYNLFIIQRDLGIFTRFQSVFTEPGHLGIIAALLLYLNKYNFRKWQCWIFLISLLWSFSLAAYLLFLLGVMLFKITNSKNIIKTITRQIFAITLVLAVSIFYYFSYPNSVVSRLIFARLEMDEKQGIAGNNRNDASFMRYYKLFEKRKEYIIGIGIEKYSYLSFLGGNSSYRVFIVQYGLIGLLLLFLFGLSVIYSYPSKLYLGLLLLYCISFYQRPYALWEIESFAFLCFAGVINKDIKAVIKN